MTGFKRRCSVLWDHQKAWWFERGHVLLQLPTAAVLLAAHATGVLLYRFYQLLKR